MCFSKFNDLTFVNYFQFILLKYINSNDKKIISGINCIEVTNIYIFNFSVDSIL